MRDARGGALAQLPVVGDTHGATSPLAHDLGRAILVADWGGPAFYQVARAGSERRPMPERALDLARQAAVDSPGGVLLALTYPLAAPPDDVELLADFTRSIAASERFHLYLLRP